VAAAPIVGRILATHLTLIGRRAFAVSAIEQATAEYKKGKSQRDGDQKHGDAQRGGKEFA
jgi:hypothetical protein